MSFLMMYVRRSAAIVPSGSIKSRSGCHWASWLGAFLGRAKNWYPLPRRRCDRISPLSMTICSSACLWGLAGSGLGYEIWEGCELNLVVCSTCTTSWARMKDGSYIRTAFFPISLRILKGPKRRESNFFDVWILYMASVMYLLSSQIISAGLNSWGRYFWALYALWRDCDRRCANLASYNVAASFLFERVHTRKVDIISANERSKRGARIPPQIKFEGCVAGWVQSRWVEGKPCRCQKKIPVALVSRTIATQVIFHNPIHYLI